MTHVNLESALPAITPLVLCPYHSGQWLYSFCGAVCTSITHQFQKDPSEGHEIHEQTWFTHICCIKSLLHARFCFVLLRCGGNFLLGFKYKLRFLPNCWELEKAAGSGRVTAITPALPTTYNSAGNVLKNLLSIKYRLENFDKLPCF